MAATGPAADPRMKNVESALQILASMEVMCNNFQTRGKSALKELKTARKGTKDKALQKDYDATGKSVEALMKSAGLAVTEYGGMLKDYAAAKKDGDFTVCAVKIKSRAPAFRVVHQHAADLAKTLESVKFTHTDTSCHAGLVGLLNYRKSFDAYYKSFKSAM